MHDDSNTQPEQDLDDVGVETVFSLLAHPHRRVAIHVLSEYGEPITLADLADEVAERGCDTALPELSPKTVQRVYLSLYHSHVPRLTEAGVVGYDQDGDLVWMRDGSTKDRLLGVLDAV